MNRRNLFKALLGAPFAMAAGAAVPAAAKTIDTVTLQVDTSAVYAAGEMRDAIATFYWLPREPGESSEDFEIRRQAVAAAGYISEELPPPSSRGSV